MKLTIEVTEWTARELRTFFRAVATGTRLASRREDLLTLTELAAELHLSERQGRRLVVAGVLVKEPGTRRYSLRKNQARLAARPRKPRLRLVEAA